MSVKLTCPECGRVIERAKREAAQWNLDIHRTHAHDFDPSRDAPAKAKAS